MTVPREALGGGGRFRIHRGETIGGVVWSNTAFTITGRYRVTYDSGKEQDIRIDDTASGSSRALVAFRSQQVATEDGWIVSGFLGQRETTATRGQCYAIVSSFDSNQQDTKDVLSCGYVWFGYPLALATYVEPGPAGGPGAISTITGTNPAAGVEVSEAVPTGAQFRLLSFSVVLVASAAVANRLPRLVVDDGTTANRRSFTTDDSTNPVTGGQTRTQLWLRTLFGIRLARDTAVDTQSMELIYGLPLENLTPSYRIRTITSGLDVNDDYAAPIYQVEEWVMPN